MEAAPPQARPALAAAASTQFVHLHWYAAPSTVADFFDVRSRAADSDFEQRVLALCAGSQIVRSKLAHLHRAGAILGRAAGRPVGDPDRVLCVVDRVGDCRRRTPMLAAISHDMRTPLTRIRLRGELIEDKEQQARLFRDVDEMQAMVDGGEIVLNHRPGGGLIATIRLPITDSAPGIRAD